MVPECPLEGLVQLAVVPGGLPWIWFCTVLPIVARSCGVKGVISSHG